MPKIYKAPFAQAKKANSAVATAAKTTYGDTANALLLVTAGADGARLTRLTAIARATNAATQLQFYKSTDLGVTLNLWRTQLMPAATLSATSDNTQVFVPLDLDNPIGLQANERIYVAIGVALASGIVFNAEWEDF